jgi:DnaJ-class molecular chaperone
MPGKATVVSDVTPEVVPEPVVKTKKLYAYCLHCAGTGEITLTNGGEPAITTPCEWCAGEGKVLFGEVEV